MPLLKQGLPALLVMALWGAPAQSQPQAQPQPGAVLAAEELLKTNHPEEALALVDPVIAQALLKEAKAPDATCPRVLAAALQAALKGGVTVTTDNDWCDAMLIKGYALNELKRPAEAAEVLRTLVGHDPGNVNYLSEYAFTLHKTGDTPASLAAYLKVEKLAAQLEDPERAAHWQAVALRGQGYNYIEQKRWDDAVKAYQRSLTYEPDNKVAQSELKYIEDNRPR